MFFLSTKELSRKKMKLVNIHYLLFALNYFIEKFKDEKLQQHLFILFFSVNLNKNLLNLNHDKLVDPPFYSFEFQNDYSISNSFNPQMIIPNQKIHT